jgi:hypothetical protein
MNWRRRFGLRPVPSSEVRGIKMAAVDGNCTNCETPLAESLPHFCPECGQDTNLNPPTLKMLLSRLGELTAQYLTGRRHQYVLTLLYRYRGMGYTEHLVFAMHLHAFWFLVVVAIVAVTALMALLI